MPKNQPTDRQRTLPRDRNERLLLIEALHADNLSAHAVANVRRLLREIEFCTNRDGCFAYVETLQARCCFGSKRTCQRAIAAAKDIGVLLAVERLDRRGQQSNEWRIQWDVMSRYRTDIDVTPTCPDVTPTRPNVTPTCPDVTLLTEEQHSSTSYQHSPPPPDADTEPATAAAPTWRAVEVSLIDLGMGSARDAVAECRERGLAPLQVLAIVECWLSKPGAWGIGALYHRLTNASPNQKATEGWPRKSRAYLKRQDDEARRRREALQRQAEKAAEAKAAERTEQLEAEFGSQLDAMDSEALKQFARRALGDFHFARFKKGCTLVREPLLEALAKEGNHRVTENTEIMS